jgi:hypothetical protein
MSREEREGNRRGRCKCKERELMSITGHYTIMQQRVKQSTMRKRREEVDKPTIRMDISGMRLRTRQDMSLVMRWLITVPEKGALKYMCIYI